MVAKLFKVFVKDTCFQIEIDENSQQSVKEIVQHFKNALFKSESDKTFYLISFDALLEEIQKYFESAPAAGGIVKNEHDQTLWIFRRGKFDMPKGKLDPGEDFPTAALREVEEECGIKDLILGNLIGYTFHIYIQNERAYFKQTAWYEMHTQQKEIVLQTEEDISDYCWANADKHRELSKITYKSLSDLLKRHLRKD